MSLHYDWIDGALQRLDQQVDCAVGMPSDSYASEEFFDQEKATIFSDRWCSIGFASEISAELEEQGCLRLVMCLPDARYVAEEGAHYWVYQRSEV